MPAEDKPATPGTIATVIATAAVTLAVGVTTAALSGYLTPPRDAQVQPVAAPPETEPTPQSPSVVLVPVSPEPRQPGPAEQPPAVPQALPDPEVIFAAHEPAKFDDHDNHDDHDDDHHRRDRGHHERERDHDDDD